MPHIPESISIWLTKSWPRSCGAALLSGVVAALAPEPVKAWPLIWVALVPLWIIVITTPQGTWTARMQVGGVGACWGLGYYGITLLWITGLHPLTWMGVPWLGSVAIALFAWNVVTIWGMVWSALWSVLLGWINTRFFLASPHSSSVHFWKPLLRSSGRVGLATALWCAIDWLWRQSFLYWPSLAFTQSPDNLWILQLGRWSGPVTVTAAIVAVNGFLAEGILMGCSAVGGGGRTDRGGDRPSTHRILSNHATSQTLRSAQRWASQGCGAIALVLFLGLHSIGGFRFFQPLTPSPLVENNPTATEQRWVDPDPIQIGIIQGNVPTRIKLFEEGLRRAFTGYTDGYIDLVNQGVDAVLTPEGAIPLYWRPEVSRRTPLYQAVVDRGIPLWLGTFVPEGRDFTQSIVTLDGDGTIMSQYNKVKLVPLGEYIPFASVLGDFVDRLSPLDAYMIPGDASQQVKTPVGQAIMGICYESAFADLFRQQAANGGEFILTASNNDPFNTVMMAQHHAQDVMRAIETDRWAVRATNTGYSGVVDPRGRTVWRSPANTYVTHVATIRRRRTQTPYVRYGDWLTPVLPITALTLLSIFAVLSSTTSQENPGS